MNNVHLLIGTALLCGASSLAMAQAPQGGAGASAPATSPADLPTPKLADGKPDLSGVWARPPRGGGAGRAGGGAPAGAPGGGRAGGGAPVDPTAGARPAASDPNVIRVFPPGSSVAQVNAGDARNAASRWANAAARPKYKPEFAAKAKELFDSGDLKNPGYSCGMQGARLLNAPSEIFARPDSVALLYDGLAARLRVIPIADKPLAVDEPLVMGTPVGKWEGDTLVITTTNFMGDYWLDGDGSYYSDKLKATERLTRKGNTLTYEVTFEDPIFVEPFKRPTANLVLGRADQHVGAIEYPCVELSLPNMVTGAKH